MVALTLGALRSEMIIVRQSRFKLGGRYRVAQVVEALQLFAAIPLPDASNWAGIYVALVGLGRQDGTAGAYGRAVIRIMPVTGIVTELGITIGHLVRSLPVDVPHLLAGIAVVLTFMFGSIVAAAIFPQLQKLTLLVAAVPSGLAELCHAVYRQYVRATTDGSAAA